MELVLDVRFPDGPQDVRVDLDPSSTVADLVQGLEAYSSAVPPGASLWRFADGRDLDPEVSVSSIGLISGETLGFARPSISRSDVAQGARLAVTSGHSAGVSIPLSDSGIRVGRSPERSDFVIADPQVSALQFVVSPDGGDGAVFEPNPEATNVVPVA